MTVVGVWVPYLFSVWNMRSPMPHQVIVSYLKCFSVVGLLVYIPKNTACNFALRLQKCTCSGKTFQQRYCNSVVVWIHGHDLVTSEKPCGSWTGHIGACGWGLAVQVRRVGSQLPGTLTPDGNVFAILHFEPLSKVSPIPCSKMHNMYGLYTVMCT